MSAAAPPTGPHAPSTPGAQTPSDDATRSTPRASRWPGSAAARLKERLGTWLHPPARRVHDATHRNVYILPSGAGWLFALLLAVLLIASINDRLALGYALTFGLAAVALVSMPRTHAQVRGLRLTLQTPEPTWAGTTAALVIEIEHPGPPRHGLHLHLRLQMPGQPPHVDLHLPPSDAGRSTVHVPLPAPRRGWQRLPALVVESRFPFGLFRAWTVWRPETARLVWPAAETPAPALPASAGLGDDAASTSTPERHGPGGFDGLRPWRTGDGPREIAWKHLARRPEPMDPVSRDTAPPPRAGRQRPVWLAWDDAAGGQAAVDRAAHGPSATPASAIEARLSRLTAWVQAAHQAGRPCGLRLPGCVIAPGQGEAHRRKLLQALALWTG